MSEPALVADDIRRSFHPGRRAARRAARRIDQPRRRRDRRAGRPSGAGKSTLLHIAGLLERPDGGEVVIGGTPCGELGDGERTRLRRERLGFIYQFHHLLPEFSALENVVLPQMIAGVGRAAARVRARELLGRLGLEPRADHRPGQLSGGEQQRVAIARAMAKPAGGPARRRADRQPRPGDRRGGLRRTARPGPPFRPRRPDRDPQPDLAQRMDRLLEIVDGIVVTR